MYPAGTSFSIDIQPPPGWDDIAVGKQGIVLIRHFVPQVPFPCLLPCLFSHSEEEEGGNQLDVGGPRVGRGEQALGLVGTKLQQPCFHKAGTSQKHGTTSISPGTLQQSLQLRGSPAPPASAWGQRVSCLKGMAWVLSVFCPYSAAVYYGIHNTTMRGITSCFSSCLLPI